MARRHVKLPKTSMMGIIGKVAPWIAFVSQITAKDSNAIQSQVGIMNQLQGYANAILGRMTGITLFKRNPVQPDQTINIGGVANQWTGLGLGAMIYGELGKHFSFLPQAAKVRSIGKKVFIGGAVGGLFDDPTQQTGYIQQGFQNQGFVAPPNPLVSTSGTLPFTGLRPF